MKPGIPVARIPDWGFWTVVVVAILAGATIIMGMKLAFDEDSRSHAPEINEVIVTTVQK